MVALIVLAGEYQQETANCITQYYCPFGGKIMVIKNTGPKALKNSKSCTDEAYRQIRLLIYNQEVVPGQKLVYDDLAKKLQMSRTPIINALNRLEQHGLVVSQSYRGFTVKPMDNREAWDSFGFREAIETFAVEQAIYDADDAEMALLEKKVLDYDNHTPGYYDRKKIFTDIAVHMQIAEISKNQVLKWHLKLTLQHIYMRARLNNYSLERMNAAQLEHHTLLAKMKNKDVLGSVEIMRNHIRTDRSYVLACISGDQSEDEDLIL